MCPTAARSAARILVVDDDALFCDAAAMTMNDAGYQIVTANHVRTGSALVREQRFDVIVADIQMPGNDRLQWLHELAQSAPGVPVVVVTGHPSLKTAITAIGLPVVAYLIKPVSAEDLLAEVDRARKGRVSGVALEGPISDQLRANLERHRERWKLTPRQVDALERVVQGDSNKEISAQLGCALRTIELHVSALLERSGQPSRAALIARFWSHRS